MLGFIGDVVVFFAPLIILGLVIWFAAPIVMDALKAKQAEVRINNATRLTKRAMDRQRKRGV